MTTVTDNDLKRLEDLINIMTVGFLSIVDVFVTGILGIIERIVFFPNT